jgi:hypothetical protein
MYAQVMSQPVTESCLASKLTNTARARDPQHMYLLSQGDAGECAEGPPTCDSALHLHNGRL